MGYLLEENEDFSNFGRRFQELLTHIIVNDRQFSDQIGEVLENDFFELEHLKNINKEVYLYKKKYGFHPTHDVIQTILNVEYPKSENNEIHEYFEKIKGKKVSDSDQEFVKDKSLDFCKKQNLKKAMLKSVSLLKNSSFEEISKIINESIKLGVDNNFGHDYLLDFEKRYELDSRQVVPTPWDEWNFNMDGGHGRGETGIVIGASGAGKSHVLVSLGAHAIKCGKNVVHYTLELSDKVIGKRYDSCLSSVDLNDLKVKKDEVFEKIKDIKGHLTIKEYPQNRTTTKTIESHLEKLLHSENPPELVIIDYGDLVGSVEKKKEKRLELASVFDEFRTIAKIYNVAVWTATQTNRIGNNTPVVTMEMISESWNKVFSADFIVTLARTMDDRSSNSGRFFIVKNRNGIDGVIMPIYMRTANVNIKVLEMSQESISDIVENANKIQQQYEKDVLKKKFEEYKKAMRA